MAGIQALVNQSKGLLKVGNPAPVYYSLATNSAVFHTVTLGDNVVNCSGTVDCYGATSSGRHGFGGGTANGELSTSSTTPSPAYSATSSPSHNQYTFAAGLGSVDAYHLMLNW
jgi:hypothetical protein